MKIEKNMILCSIFALTIGIATIVPLTFFMNTTEAQPDDEQWFNIDCIYAYYNAFVVDAYDDGYVTNDLFQNTGVILFDALPNYEALSQQQHIDTRIEIFEILFYTDDLQLSKSYEYVGMDRPGLENPTFSSATFRSDFMFNDPLLSPWCYEPIDISPKSEQTLSWNGSSNLGSPIPSGGRYITNATNLTPEKWQDMGSAGTRGGYTDEISDTKLSALKNTRTIYLDIRRIGYITVDDSATIIASKCNQLIQHIELTKNNTGEFTFGNPTAFIDDVVSPLFGLKPDQLVKPSNGQHSMQFW
ncbi:MAG: hypothetical protein LBC12_01730 [Nitrososphaerota archaeon]|jgi:hypothetical protein|nr:hypothetical protein [Nitrososphaerota archaeon]